MQATPAPDATASPRRVARPSVPVSASANTTVGYAAQAATAASRCVRVRRRGRRGLPEAGCQVDRLQLRLRNVLTEKEAWAECASTVASYEHSDVPDVIRLENDHGGWGLRIKPLPDSAGIGRRSKWRLMPPLDPSPGPASSEDVRDAISRGPWPHPGFLLLSVARAFSCITLARAARLYHSIQFSPRVRRSELCEIAGPGIPPRFTRNARRFAGRPRDPFSGSLCPTAHPANYLFSSACGSRVAA